MATGSSPVLDGEVLHDLILRSAQHDESAFAEYFRLTSPFLNAVVARRNDSAGQVETTLVSTYVAIWRQSGDYVTSGSSSVWEWTLRIMEQAIDEPAGSRRP